MLAPGWLIADLRGRTADMVMASVTAFGAGDGLPG
jgi:hypothetical protein